MTASQRSMTISDRWTRMFKRSTDRAAQSRLSGMVESVEQAPLQTDGPPFQYPTARADKSARELNESPTATRPRPKPISDRLPPPGPESTVIRSPG